jgi:hypothetical protein
MRGDTRIDALRIRCIQQTILIEVWEFSGFVAFILGLLQGASRKSPDVSNRVGVALRAVCSSTAQ